MARGCSCSACSVSFRRHILQGALVQPFFKKKKKKSFNLVRLCACIVHCDTCLASCALVEEDKKSIPSPPSLVLFAWIRFLCGLFPTPLCICDVMSGSETCTVVCFSAPPAFFYITVQSAFPPCIANMHSYLETGICMFLFCLCLFLLT